MKHSESHDHHEHLSNIQNTNENQMQPWEKSCHALLDILEKKNIITLKTKLETWEKISNSEKINGESYYEHWILSATQILIENGFLQHSEIHQKTNSIALNYIKNLENI